MADVERAGAAQGEATQGEAAQGEAARKEAEPGTAYTVLYLDDLQVGQRFVSGSHTLTAEEIKRFAADYDPQPFHMDEIAAQDTFFNGLAASGWNTLGVTMRLLVKGPLRVAGGLIGAGAEIEWPRPTRPGDVLSVESEVLEVTPFRSKPDRGLVRLRTETRDQNGALLQVFTAKLIVPRRAAAES